MCLGIYLLFSPLKSLVSWIPLVGFLLAHGVDFIAVVFAVIVSVFFTTMTIALSWIYYRPFYAICLISVVGISTALLMFTVR